MADDVQSKVQQHVTQNLNDLFEHAINERKQHFIDKPQTIPQRGDVDAIISRCANTNALVAGGIGRVHGPRGMLPTIPENIAVMLQPAWSNRRRRAKQTFRGRARGNSEVPHPRARHRTDVPCRGAGTCAAIATKPCNRLNGLTTS